MTIDLEKFFDSYNRHARVYPALLTLLPLILTTIAWFPTLIASSLTDVILSLLVTCGLLYMFASFSRTLGKRHEKRLLAAWGGWPTTAWLHHSDANLSPQTKARYHAFFTQRVAGLVLPTLEQEESDPEAARGAYDSAVAWLKEQCRSKDFAMVHRENTQYGFRRNLRGMRVIGMLVAFVSLFVTVGHITFAAYYGQPASTLIEILKTVPLLVWVTVTFSIIALITWIFLVRDTWVREAGDQYAQALLANCDSLSGDSNTG